MANTLTNLIPTMYEALDIVSRELVGFLPAVYRDSNVERAQINQEVLVPVVPAMSATDATASMNKPSQKDHAIDNVPIKLTKDRFVDFSWSGEEQRGLNTAGTRGAILRDQFAQAFRTLTNEVEADLASVYVEASRAHGTAGTTPFATADDLSDIAGVRQILDDNGVPQTDLHLVLGSAAIANIRGKQASLFKVNEAGSDELLRTGSVGTLEGVMIHNSAQVKAHVKGTGASYDTDLLAGWGVGDTALHVDTGTGTIKAGDVVTFAGDANKYIVNTGFEGDGDGDIVLNKPGLRLALADGVDVAIGNSYRANLAFHRSAIVLATRTPAIPAEGDDARDRMIITDPRSGLSFEVSVWGGFRMVTIHVALVWGWKLIKPEHVAILLG